LHGSTEVLQLNVRVTVVVNLDKLLDLGIDKSVDPVVDGAEQLLGLLFFRHHSDFSSKS